MFLSALFSGMETGLYCTNRMRLKLDALAGDKTSERLLKVWDNLERNISTMLFANNLTVELLAIASLAMLIALTGNGTAQVLNVFVAPFIIVFFIDILPKNIFQSNPNNLMLQVSRFLHFLNIVFFPFTVLMALFAKTVSRLMGGNDNTAEKSFVFNRHTLSFALSEVAREGSLSRTQQKLSMNIMALRQYTAQNIMKPLNTLPSISDTSKSAALETLCQNTNQDLVTVFDEKTSEIVGVCSLYDAVFKAEKTLPVKNLICFSPNDNLYQVLAALRNKKSKIGIVMQKDGTAQGIIELEDLTEYLLEEIEK
jgi:putative hemolysin